MKTKIKFFVDTVMLISFIITAVSTFMGRSARDIHGLFGGIFIAVTVIHFILNWEMFVGMGKGLFKKNENEQNDKNSII